MVLVFFLFYFLARGLLSCFVLERIKLRSVTRGFIRENGRSARKGPACPQPRSLFGSVGAGRGGGRAARAQRAPHREGARSPPPASAERRPQTQRRCGRCRSGTRGRCGARAARRRSAVCGRSGAAPPGAV